MPKKTNKADKPPRARKEQAIIDSLSKASTISAACKAAGVNRDYFYEHCKKDPTFKADVDAARDSLVYATEDALYKNMKDGNQKAIEYILNNRSGGRWSNQQKFEHSGNIAATVTILGNVSTDEV